MTWASLMPNLLTRSRMARAWDSLMLPSSRRVISIPRKNLASPRSRTVKMLPSSALTCVTVSRSILAIRMSST
ncbi:MAG: hypothetical protein ACK5QX_04360 [bacterium]